MRSIIAMLLLFSITIKAQQNWQQKDFIITMWCSPPANNENYQVLKRDNYNLTYLYYYDSIVPGNIKQWMDLAQKNGIRCLLSHPLLQPGTLKHPSKKAKLDSIINSIKDHPAFEGYHLVDEPDAATFADWSKLKIYLKEKDPKHLAYINLLPFYSNEEQSGLTRIAAIERYKEYLNQFTTTLKPELLSYDHYLFFKKNDEAEYFSNLAMIRDAAKINKIPFLTIVQASTIEPEWRLPNENELHWLAYTGMLYGSRGISWFLYWGPPSYGGLYQNGVRQPIADHVAKVNKEIKALGPELMKLTSTHIYHTAPFPKGTEKIPKDCPVKIKQNDLVLGMFEQNGSENTFMVMNRNYKKNASARIKLKLGKGKLMEYSVDSGKWIELKKIRNCSKVKIQLAPGSGKLFRIEPNN